MSGRNLVIVIVITLLVGASLGRFLGRGGDSGEELSRGNGVHAHDGAAEEKSTIWTCSMHPQIKLPEPGKCPICFMDLIPMDAGAAGDADVPRLEMSEAARALAEIQVVPVRRDRPFVEVRLVGKVAWDETKVGAITARVPGRLDRLYVDYTGITVRKGDHLAEIYSPDLLSAGEELLQAIRTRDSMSGSGSGLMRETGEATVQAVRDKLRLLGVTSGQIRRIEEGREPSDHVTLFAPIGGVVIEKRAVEGDYVSTGSVIYRIADLSTVWVLLDAHESDLAWIRHGQDVEFRTEAVPGETFRSRVAFISPMLDPVTRTAKVRVNVDNEKGLLKPEMLASATILAETDGVGGVVARDLAGHWICPMHPEVVEKRRGSCRVCGMDLVRAEDLGYVTAGAEGEGALLVPRSAVLFTGKRAIVYVEIPDTDMPTYDGREIVLGPRAGEFYVVRSGLEAGESVVVNGNFKIDSALQIQAKPSMMSPGGGGPPSMPGHEGHGTPLAASSAGSTGFAAGLSPVYASYFELWNALAADDAAEAVRKFEALGHGFHGVDDSSLPATGRRKWRELAKEVAGAAKAAAAAAATDTPIEGIRAQFEVVSKAVIAMERSFGHVGSEHYVTFCPMAFDFRGAYWLQDSETVNNPYFGATMLRCGTVEEKLAARGGGKS